MRSVVVSTLLIILIFIIFSCDKKEIKEIEITVLSTVTELRSEPGESEILKFAVVEYCAKNIGISNINGWEVYFNVHIERGPQQLAYESIYYLLEPEEESKVRAVECIIPDYYEDAYKATLKHVEAW